MHVFLIHGMGRTQVSMAILARRLAAAGHDVASFGYFVTRDPLDVIADKLVAFVSSRLGGDTAAPFAVVGHSLGNIVTRAALPRLPGLSRFVMLAPPNQPPVMARALRDNPVFRLLTRDAGRKLLDESFYAALPVPTMPALVVAGTRGPRASWLPFRGEPSDGVVRVAETRLDGAAHVEVRAVHTFIMNDAGVARLVAQFLASGRLEDASVDTGRGDEPRDVETASPPR